MRTLPCVACVLVAAGVAACTTLREPRGCSEEIVRARQVRNACGNGEGDLFVEALESAFDSELTELAPRSKEFALILLRLGDHGVADACVETASSSRFGLRLEDALAGFQQRFEANPPACAVGARLTMSVGKTPTRAVADCSAAHLASSPQRIRNAPPPLRVPRIPGYVHLRFSIRPDGSPADIEVVESSPPGVFDEAAKAALAEWRYCPPFPASSSTRIRTRP